MAVEDALRRLSQMDSIFLAQSFVFQGAPTSIPFKSWHKGRVLQANDGSWVFRSISMDGTIVGFELGTLNASWTSSETPSTGIVVHISMPLGTPDMTAIGLVLVVQLS